MRKEPFLLAAMLKRKNWKMLSFDSFQKVTVLCLSYFLLGGGVAFGGAAVEAGSDSHAEKALVYSLQPSTIIVDSQFKGTEVSVHGFILDDHAVAAEGGTQVILEFVGPPQKHRSYQKIKKFGIWTNSFGQEFSWTPSLYQVASTALLNSLLPKRTQQALEIGNDHFPILFKNKDLPQEQQDYWRRSFVKEKAEKGLYIDETLSINLSEKGRLFTTKFFVPGSISEGVYEVHAYMVENGEVVYGNRRGIPLRVIKVGLSKQIKEVALQHSWIYGIFAVLISCLLGGGVYFLRRDKN